MLKLARKFAAGAALSAIVGLATSGFAAADSKLLNVSYDPTRELYKAYDAAFAKHWKEVSGEDISIEVSNGGSGSQARKVIDGLEADVVTLALAYDIDAIAKSGEIDAKWQSRLPNNSTPYTSTIVFLVRKGNPKGIKDWGDLVKGDVQVITPNPKTSGGARWAYLAAWGWALKQPGGSEDTAKAFVGQLYKHVPVLDTGARGSTTTFVQREIGDVLLAWENEAYLAVKELGPDKFDIVNPSISILAEPPVTLVDKVVDAHGTRKQAEEYLKYLYSPEAQEIEAAHYYRPTDPTVAAKYKDKFPQIPLFTLADTFGTWSDVQKKHFADGGVFDQIYQPQ
jgi:sulfate transport system substrate-binding protein